MLNILKLLFSVYIWLFLIVVDEHYFSLHVLFYMLFIVVNHILYKRCQTSVFGCVHLYNVESLHAVVVYIAMVIISILLTLKW